MKGRQLKQEQFKSVECFINRRVVAVDINALNEFSRKIILSILPDEILIEIARNRYGNL